MAVFLALTTASACAQRSQQTASIASTASAATTESAVAASNTSTLRLNEVQLTENAGQRSLLFRFSRPPEGVDYFPLRNPSRLVVDVKGPIDSPSKVQTYQAIDSQVTSVRVGSYQGRLRLVIDLKGAMVPQFSVDNYETLVTAFIGEKDVTKSASSKSRSQVLMASAEGEGGKSEVGAGAQPEKRTIPPVNSASREVPAERPSIATQESEKPESVAAAEALSEEKLSSTPIHTPIAKPAAKPAPIPAPTVEAVPEPPPVVKVAKPVPAPPPAPPAQVAPAEKKPIDIAQATTVTPEKAPAPAKPRLRERLPRRETPTRPPASISESSPFSNPEGEFRPTEYSGRKISLDFKVADIHDVFRILAEVSGLNIVATDDVKARVTLRLVEVPWDQALDVVLQANGLEKTRVGNVITISTTKRLENERTARLSALNAQRKLASLETAYVKINYVKATDIVSILTRETEQMVATTIGEAGGRPGAPGAAGGRNQQVALLSPRGTIAADATTNVVVVRDVATNVAAIRELISQIDVQTPQVVIESYIITTNENLNRDLGIQWGYQYTASPRTGNPTGVNFPGTIGVGGVDGLLNSGTGGVPFMVDFPSSAAAGAGSVLDLALGSLAGTQALNVRLSALENQGKARVVARPRVVTLNNKAAEIKSRRIVRVPVVSGRTSIVTSGSGGDSGNAFQEFDVGITLKITPQISSDGYVLLDISAESSELTDPSIRVGGSGNAFPLIPDSLSRTTSSNVLIRANDTFVLGGIFQDNMRQTERGIPYLRDTPGIGWLFRGNLRNKNKDELMVFITPKLVAGSGTAGLPTAQQLWEKRSKEAVPAEKSASVITR
jgi:type IV pilus assembly protein PilQ